MTKAERILRTQIKMGYWHGFTMAMYPNQFTYKEIDVDFENIWKDRNEVNLYYHIPFCKSICPYCGFFTIAQNNKEYIGHYIDKLNEQMKIYASYFDKTGVIKSICFGGGTPNHAPIESYYKIFKTLENCNVKLDKNIEPSMEVSPELINENYIKELENIGIKRLSLGVQSLDLNLRSTINRDNNYSLFDLIDIMRKYNMNINIDVMSGIVGQTKELFMDTLKKLMIIKPETISIYPLAGKDSSMIKKNDNVMTNKEKYELFRDTYQFLLENDYYCESNVKFVLKNQPSTHQQKIYEYQGVDTMGLGCGARSYNYYTHYGIEARFNSKNRKLMLDQYIETDFRKMKYYGIHLDEEDRKSRFAIYGMFTGRLDMRKYQQIFTNKFEEDFGEQMEALLNIGLIDDSEDGVLVLTEEGRVYTDLVCVQFWSEKVKNIYNINR